MKCLTCGTTEDIVYSGVDAFCLGVETEKICYSCANAVASNKRAYETRTPNYLLESSNEGN
jgi:hypothetical protein